MISAWLIMSQSHWCPLVMKTLNYPQLWLQDKDYLLLFRNGGCVEGGQALAKPNLDEWSLSSCAAAGSIWSPGVDRFYPSLLTEIHWHSRNHWGVLCHVVNEMNLSMEKEEKSFS